MNMHPAALMLRSTLVAKKQEEKPILDDASGNTGMSIADFTEKDIAMAAIAGVQEWCESDDLDDGETMADRLMAIMVGVADANKDGEITEDEQGVLDIALDAAWEYVVSKGVTDEDADALFNDWDSSAAERVCELLKGALPDGPDASVEEIEEFVFGDGASESALDAVYKMKMAVRGGKKVRIRKRVSGTVRLSAKQKMSIRKAGMKAHTAGARMRRMKSMGLRKKMGVK